MGIVANECKLLKAAFLASQIAAHCCIGSQLQGLMQQCRLGLQFLDQDICRLQQARMQDLNGEQGKRKLRMKNKWHSQLANIPRPQLSLAPLRPPRSPVVLWPPPQENQGFKNAIIKENLDVIRVWEYLDTRAVWACLHVYTLLCWSLSCSMAENFYPGGEGGCSHLFSLWGSRKWGDDKAPLVEEF